MRKLTFDTNNGGILSVEQMKKRKFTAHTA